MFFCVYAKKIRRSFSQTLIQTKLKKKTINTELTSIDQWYESNGMRRNHSKYQAMVMGKSQAKLQFYCENTTIPISEHLNLLGITIDNKLGPVVRKPISSNPGLNI